MLPITLYPACKEGLVGNYSILSFLQEQGIWEVDIMQQKQLSCFTIHKRLLRFLSLLLISSVCVATLSMQPRLVELWKVRAQKLTRLYSDQKHKQRGTSHPVYSSQIRCIPIILSLWFVVVCSTILLSLNLNSIVYMSKSAIVLKCYTRIIEMS